MKLAVISDIHGNMEAFEAVLADIDANDVGDVICLGDSIGYGPEPENVIGLLQKRRIPSVMGNHELAVMDEMHIRSFNPLARISIIKTIAMLSKDTIGIIGGFPLFLSAAGIRFVHGFPPASPTTYLFEVFGKQLEHAFLTMAENICFVGHTHYLKIIGFDGVAQTSNRPVKGIFHMEKYAKYIVNAGSVGQPRDGDKHAKYVILDDAARTLDIRFIPYDIETVTKKIRVAGLPEYNALRLR